ncbi:tRNA(Met) cytidine acetyltransferase TmcA [Aquisalimonas asiatica]|uniref:tRNA(Met) cytidine acetyltransferase TmcA n=1 Tax=Aquisalimonas asiatica TaxID=406100 RepID=A0A1H8QLK4_9GAMM|nr:GNAT family N-acetyltransferase [Aquisalimonas asiatica]SEO54881.1 tRNA(Met)-cytidine N(4)-acetyltransferase [Aquisalimonas asiatica]
MNTRAADLKALGQALRDDAGAAGWRRMVVLSGTQPWCRSQALDLLAGSPAGDSPVLWAGHAPPAETTGAAPDGLGRYLGTEAQALVIDAYDGLDPDGLGAGVGTVRAGGLVVLLTPPLDEWADFDDPQLMRLAVDGYDAAAVGRRFTARLARILANDPGVVRIREGHPLPQWGALERAPELTDELEDADCISADQVRGVEAVLRTATGHRRRPAVLTADRGRGKSAALGIAAARVLSERGGTVVVTAPRRAAVDAVLHHAARVLETTPGRSEVRAPNGGVLRFMVPDELAGSREAPDLVLVDEAAALPPHRLGQLLRDHSRIVFATTVHGYEGSGRGFVLRFQPVLDAETPHWRHVPLVTPVRWRQGCPVEALLFRMLLLDAELPDADDEDVASAPVTAQVLDRDALATDETLLRGVFGLLVHAHYRTRPLDLRNLLDGPNLQLHLLWRGAVLAGVAMVATEGGFEPAVARAIWAGERRPRGHLLPQGLAAHVGVRQGAACRAARIMRIAVHPRLQGHGFGLRLVEHIAGAARGAGHDVLGASFGATTGLLAFWRRAGCVPLRLGVRRDAASGTHSALVARPLTARGAELVKEGRSLFARDFPAQLADPLRQVEPELALALFADLAVPPPDERDWLDAAGFAHGHRAYEVVIAALRPIARAVLTSSAAQEWLSTRERRVLLARVIQQRPWQESAEVCGLTGRPAVIDVLRRSFRTVIAHQAPEWVRRLVASDYARSSTTFPTT